MNSVILYIINIITFLVPETRGFGVKRFLYRLAGAKIGKNVRICSSVKIIGCGQLSIGDGTWVGHEVLIVSSSKIKIGANVDIAPRVYIGTGTHVVDLSSANIAGQGISKDVIIENGCWLGVNSAILPGVTVKEKCIIAGGSLLNKTIDKTYVVIAGNPARVVKSLLT